MKISFNKPYTTGMDFRYIDIKKIINPGIPTGWTSIMAAIIFFGGIQLLSIGLLGEYIGRVFLSINKKPQYVIKEKYSIDKVKSKNDNN